MRKEEKLTVFGMPHTFRYLIILTCGLLIGCGAEEMDSRTESAETSYGIQVCKDKIVNGTDILLDNWSEPMEFTVESASGEHQLAVSFFCDYRQIPIVIEGKTCSVFYIDATSYYSGTFSFSLAKMPESGKIHRLVCVLNADTNYHAKNQTQYPVVTSDSIVVDYNLVIENASEIVDLEAAETDPEQVYEAQGSDILLNTCADEIARKVPEKEVKAKTGENLRLQYHAGGYSAGNDFLFFVTADSKQIKINGQDYLYFSGLLDCQIAAGYLELQVPEEPGEYEIIGYMIPNPLKKKEEQGKQNQKSYRFTLTVE